MLPILVFANILTRFDFFFIQAKALFPQPGMVIPHSTHHTHPFSKLNPFRFRGACPAPLPPPEKQIELMH